LQYPNDIAGETPNSGMANALSAIWRSREQSSEYVSVHSVVGFSGNCLAAIDKEGGKRAYPASINETRVWKSLADKSNKTYGVGAVILTHGECDKSNPAYGTGLYQFWQDYNTDLKGITGQTRDVVLLASQQSSRADGPDSSAVQVWQAGVAHPQQIICTGPKYAYQYAPGNVHLLGPGYERLGEKYAEVFDLVFNQQVAWAPLQPKQVTRTGAIITVDFKVPNPPLVWDSHLAPPHQTQNTEWANGKGFEVNDSAGKALGIKSTTIQGNSVIVTLQGDPGAGKVHVGYALTQDGATGLDFGGLPEGFHGLLRDSDPFIGYDAETLGVQVVQGSAVIKSVLPKGFLRRAGRDLVSGAGIAADTIVMSHDTDDQLTLSAPWLAATGQVSLAFHHDAWNFCVHFSMIES